MTKLDSKTKEIMKIMGRSKKKISKEGTILGINEAATKLWQDYLLKPNDKKKLGERISNVIIGALVAADKLGVKNVDKKFQDRIYSFSKSMC